MSATKESLQLKLSKCKIMINDDLSEFKTIRNLISQPTPDLDNIKYICDSGIKVVENFINEFNIETEEPEIIQENKIKQFNFNIKNIKSYKDVLIALDKKNYDVDDEELDPEERCVNAFKKLLNICKAFNQGWIPDWNNPNEYKWYPWFYLDDKGGGFRVYDVNYHFSYSNVTARLYFKTEELAQLSVELFKDIYKEYFEYKM